MKDKKSTTESFDQWDAWAQRTYRTGGTQPPKSNGGLIAFLLVVIIFLCGISSALGLMNIRLFRQLTTLSYEETSPVTFSQSAVPAEASSDAPLGFLGQEVSTFWQNYRDLPQGIYVTEVIVGSHASRQGVLPGDILVAVNDQPVPDTAALQSLLSSHAPGDTLTVKFVRQGQDIVLTLTLE